eukprot:scaffold301_cov243-Pinguiococcus_pyrenoidosus.AAC.168
MPPVDVASSDSDSFSEAMATGARMGARLRNTGCAFFAKRSRLASSAVVPVLWGCTCGTRATKPFRPAVSGSASPSKESFRARTFPRGTPVVWLSVGRCGSLASETPPKRISA